jgi:hypothetical protein
MEHDPKWVRRKILQVLKQRHPNYVRDDELSVLLSDEGCRLDARTMASALTFLAHWPHFESGYIHLRELPAKKSNPRGFESCITPRGLNLLDPSTPDTDDCVAEF